jgi:hypothetical protein
MAGDRQEFSKEISDVDHSGKKDDAELKLLNAVP